VGVGDGPKLSDGVVNTVETAPETAEHFAACRSIRRRDIVYTDFPANQRHHFAVSRGGGIGQISDIDRQQIHGWMPSNRAAITADQHLQFVCGPMGIAVGVSDGNQSQTRAPLCIMADVADLHDARPQLDELDGASRSR
jgi:hypothetical protein